MKKIIIVLLFIVISSIVYAGIIIRGTGSSVPTIEDIDTDWTEVDPGNDLSANDTTVTMTAFNTRQEQAYYYKDLGIDEISGNFRTYFTVNIASDGAYAMAYMFTVSDVLNDMEDIAIGNDEAIGVRIYGASASNPTIRIGEASGGDVELSTDWNIAAYDTDYFCDFYRNGSTAYLYVYGSSANREAETSDLFNTSLVLDGTALFQYLLLTQTSEDDYASVQQLTGVVKDVYFGTSLW